MSGTLYLCATPIGNLDDMTIRCISTLKSVDLIAAEDTRTSRVLLDYFGIETPLTSYHKFNEKEKSGELIEKLLDGMDIAVITDAGTPGISDPGEILAGKCIENGITVTPVPGACALVSALCVSGKNTGSFVFEGFIPREKKERDKVLQRIGSDTRTVVLYEAPHRIAKTLAYLKEALGNRRITVCRELTKKFEEIIYTDLESAAEKYKEEKPRGEFVIVIEGMDESEIRKEEARKWEGVPIEDHVAWYEARGQERKEAMKSAAADLGISKREVYNLLNRK